MNVCSFSWWWLWDYWAICLALFAECVCKITQKSSNCGLGSVKTAEIGSKRRWFCAKLDWKETDLRIIFQLRSKNDRRSRGPNTGKGKGEHRQANRPGGRRSMQTESPESEGRQLYKRKQTTWFAFFLLLLHTTKNVGKRPSARRIWQRNVGRWQTRHAVLTNMARCVCKFSTLRLPKSNAEKCAKTSKKPWFCKVQVPILNSYFLILNCNILCFSVDLI